MNLCRTGVIFSTLCLLTACSDGIHGDLRDAAIKERAEKVDALIDEGADVNSKDVGWRWDGRLNYSSRSNIDWHCRYNFEALDHAECD